MTKNCGITRRSLLQGACRGSHSELWRITGRNSRYSCNHRQGAPELGLILTEVVSHWQSCTRPREHRGETNPIEASCFTTGGLLGLAT